MDSLQWVLRLWPDCLGMSYELLKLELGVLRCTFVDRIDSTDGLTVRNG